MRKPNAAAVLVAAGVGSRLKAGTRKANVMLGGKALFEWPLQSLLKSPEIGEISLVVHPKDLKARQAWVARRNYPKTVQVAAGGDERQHSVANGLAQLVGGWELLLVHDAARPFLTRSLIHACLKAAARFGGAIAAVPVKDSTKLIEGNRLKSLPRERLLAAQTPQAFQAGLLLRAHAWAAKSHRLFTDEASLLEARGHHAAPVRAYYENFKVTTPEDLAFAKRLIKTFAFK